MKWEPVFKCKGAVFPSTFFLIFFTILDQPPLEEKKEIMLTQIQCPTKLSLAHIKCARVFNHQSLVLHAGEFKQIFCGIFLIAPSLIHQSNQCALLYSESAWVRPFPSEMRRSLTWHYNVKLVYQLWPHGQNSNSWFLWLSYNTS